MHKWGIATTFLALAVVLLAGLLALQLFERPVVETPEVKVDRKAELDLETQRIELERERVELEALRLKAKIQADLARAESDLGSLELGPDDPRKREALVDAIVEYADGEEDIVRAEETEAELAPVPVSDPAVEAELLAAGSGGRAGIPGSSRFTPDKVAYEDFREPLEHYGEWFETENYGPVWQPADQYISEDWAPYTNGSWGYSDYGWSWESGDPFGWACDHYGRWTRLSGRGWCWVPGSEWATAWVSWRSNGRHIGWIPLPACATWNRSLGIGSWVDAHCGIGPQYYNFVSVNDFASGNCRSVIIDRARNVDLVNSTRNVTDLHFRNGSVRNHGPGYEEVIAVTGSPLPKREIDAAEEYETLRHQLAKLRAGRGKAERKRLAVIGVAEPDRGWAAVQKVDQRREMQKRILADARRSLAGRDQAGAGIRKVVLSGSRRALKVSPELILASLPEPRAREARTIQLKADGTPDQPSPEAIAEVVAEEEAEPLPDHLAAEQARREEALAAQELMLAERQRLIDERRQKELAARQRIEDQIRERDERREQLQRETWARFERQQAAQRAAAAERAARAEVAAIPDHEPVQNRGVPDQASRSKVQPDHSQPGQMSSSARSSKSSRTIVVRQPQAQPQAAGGQRSKKTTQPSSRSTKTAPATTRSQPASQPKAPSQPSKAPASAAGRSQKQADPGKSGR